MLVLIGIYILAPEFNIKNTHFEGVLWGIMSAVFFSLRNILLKKVTATTYNGTVIMMYQLLVITIVFSPILFFMDFSNITTEYPYVIMLALLSTAIGHTLFIRGLKRFSASTASIILSTQPIYGIILAYIFLNEIPSQNTYIGGALILSTVIIESVRSKK